MEREKLKWSGRKEMEEKETEENGMEGQGTGWNNGREWKGRG